jgi:hypothetical protein
MAGLNLFTNNAATTLASSITNVATSLTVAAGTGALFPTLAGSQYFYCTIANNAGTNEIVKVTARSTDTFTIVRAQDGTSAVAWSSGDKVELRLTRIDLLNFPQLDSTNTFATDQTFSGAITGSTGIFNLGSGQFYKDASGNVGIGTSSPGAKLSISVGNLSGTSNSYGIGIYSDSPTNAQLTRLGSTYAYNGISGTGTMLYSYDTLNIMADTSNPIKFSAGAAERMRIGPTGEIGLGGANYGTSGQVLTSGGSGAAASWTTVTSGFTNMQVFTSPGTFTTPSTTTKIKVTVVGGGASGGARINPAPAPVGSAAGGGGGGTAIYVGPITASTPYAITVGAGGTGVTATSIGNPGGTSSFGSLASATGGSAGPNTGPTSFVAGGAGGAGTTGTLLLVGGTGGNGLSAAPGGSSQNIGGSSAFGGGTSVSSPSVGNYGGGGGGAPTSPTISSAAGGGGVVIVEY